MDDAKTFCRNELRKRGNPPQMELDDILQEWSLAELQGLNPRAAVAKVLQRSVKEGRVTETSDKMHLWPDQERDGISDEELGQFLEIELEIELEQQAILWEKAARALEELPGLVPDELPAIRMHFGLDCQPMSIGEIAVALHKTEQQAEYLVSRGVEHLRLLVTSKKVTLPLFVGESDEVRVKIETYRRKETGRFKRQEADMFAA